MELIWSNDTMNVLNGELKDIYNADDDFFYDKEDYMVDRLIIDLPYHFIGSPHYYDYYKFLIDKGFNVLYMGSLYFNDFGLPTPYNRTVFVCSRTSRRFTMPFIDDNRFIAPFSLLNGRKMSELKTKYNNLVKKHTLDVEKAEKIYYLFINHYDATNKSLLTQMPDSDIVNPILDFLEDSVNLNDRRHKFADKSNDVPKGNRKKVKDKIDDDERIPCIGLIDRNMAKNYYHYNPKRDFCTIREILRLNGYPDDYECTCDDRDKVIDYVENHISPFILDLIWRNLY